MTLGTDAERDAQQKVERFRCEQGEHRRALCEQIAARLNIKLVQYPLQRLPNAVHFAHRQVAKELQNIVTRRTQDVLPVWLVEV